MERERWIAQGKCPSHRQIDLRPGRRSCDRCVEQATQRARALRAKGKCKGHPSSDVVAGKNRCQKCIDTDVARWRLRRDEGRCYAHPEREGVSVGRCHECRTRKRGYDMAPGQYDALSQLQSGVCAICKQPERSKKQHLAVDHCHRTQRIRGLLCLSCNTTLGNVKESTDTLKAMIVYLESWK